MAIRSPHILANEPACHCGAPKAALRLAFVAVVVTLIVGWLIVGIRVAGAAPVHASLGGASLGPACAPLPIVAQHRYRMAAKIRPLLFWIGRDNVGEAQVVWHAGGSARGVELLIGSDPDRAPRRINRWG